MRVRSIAAAKAIAHGTTSATVPHATCDPATGYTTMNSSSATISVARSAHRTGSDLRLQYANAGSSRITGSHKVNAAPLTNSLTTTPSSQSASTASSARVQSEKGREDAAGNEREANVAYIPTTVTTTSSQPTSACAGTRNAPGSFSGRMNTPLSSSPSDVPENSGKASETTAAAAAADTTGTSALRGIGS